MSFCRHTRGEDLLYLRIFSFLGSAKQFFWVYCCFCALKSRTHLLDRAVRVSCTLCTETILRCNNAHHLSWVSVKMAAAAFRNASFPEIKIFYKIQNSLDLFKCPKMSGKVQETSRKKKKKSRKKKLSGDCFHREGFFPSHKNYKIQIINRLKM